GHHGYERTIALADGPATSLRENEGKHGQVVLRRRYCGRGLGVVSSWWWPPSPGCSPARSWPAVSRSLEMILGLDLFSGSPPRPSHASTSTAAEHRTLDHSPLWVQETAADRDLIACMCTASPYRLVTFRTRRSRHTCGPRASRRTSTNRLIPRVKC